MSKAKARSVSNRTLSRSVVREPKELPKLVEQMRKDYQIQFAERILRALVGKIKTTIDVDGDSRANVLAKNLEDQFTSSLVFALDAIAYGRAAFEKTYCYEGGAWLVDRLDYLPFQTSEMALRETGDVAVKLPAVKDQPAVTLEPGECWWFALDPTPLEPHGRSMFLNAIEPWKDKRALEKQEDIWYQKYAIGHGIARAPSEMPKQGTRGKGDKGEVGADGLPIDPLGEMEKRLHEIQSGGNLVLPSERDPKNGQPIYDYTPSPGVRDAGPWTQRAEDLDKRILRSFGIPERAVTQDAATGSYAMAQVHLEVLADTVEGIHRQLVKSFQANVIDPAVALNFPAGSAKLTLSAQSIRDQAKALMVDIAKAIITAAAPSPIVTEGVIDLPRLLEVCELPIGENVEQRMAAVRKRAMAMLPSAPVAPGVPAQAGDAGAATVSDTALNGAQIASLLEIIQGAAADQLPMGAVMPLIKASFPMLSDQVITGIVKPIAAFNPAPEPAQMSTLAGSDWSAPATAEDLSASLAKFGVRTSDDAPESPNDPLWPQLKAAIANRDRISKTPLDGVTRQFLENQRRATMASLLSGFLAPFAKRPGESSGP